MVRRLRVIALTLFGFCHLTLANAPVANVSSGALIGEEILVSGDSIRVFKGIPYALPPVGERRWKPAQPLMVGWDGQREATSFSPACMQPQTVKDKDHLFYNPMPQMSEDCLYLNIWAPADTGATSATNHPVMVWIHGGSLVDGASSMSLYNGSELARKGAVVVSINYRLNVFGYFAHPRLSAESSHHASGNYGVTDQIQALKWVRENIAAFGGDPNNVTIFGESAGAYSVVQLLVSPLSKGLFHRAIAQSPYLKPLPALKREQYGLPAAEGGGLKFARSLGGLSIAELRDLPAMALMDAVNKIEDTYAMIPNPVVDGWVFPAQLFELFEQGRQHNVPILFGYNSNEGFQMSFRSDWNASLPDNREDYIKKVNARYGALADDYLAVYPPENPHELAYGPYRDGFFGWAAQKVVRESQRVSSRAYLYYFDHSPRWAQEKGVYAFHTAELPFAFNNLKHNAKYSNNWPDPNPRRADLRLADAMSDYWVAFAKQGAPNVEGLPRWPAYTGESRGYMAFRNGRAEPGKNLLPGTFELHEKILKARREAGDMPWSLINIGLLAPVQP